jgi:carboxymethylenebutenolidase
MNPHAQYLAEEVAENHAAGELSRREAMRRLAYLGFTAAGASALLAACGGGSNKAATTAPTTAGAGSSSGSSSPSAPPTTNAPLKTQDITYPGKGITLQGVFAAASSPKGAVLVMHENRGITDFIRTIVGRLAADGYTALAVDLLSAQGGTAAIPDTAQLQQVLVQNATDRATDDMKSTLTELQRRVPNAKLGVTGFCFGGNMVWQLLVAGDPPPLAAAVPFYGQLTNDDLSHTKAAVLAIYAELDTRVNASRDFATSAMEKAKLPHDVRTFPGVNHAFMNYTGSAYDATQAAAAYQAMLDWFGKYLR